MKSAKYILPALLLMAFLPGGARADSVLDSPHNLSAGSSATIKSTQEVRVCIFCHTPHHATLLSDPEYPGPLWSRPENTNTYTVYDSSTIQAKPGQPQGVSRLCLSCHDGTIALADTGAISPSDSLKSQTLADNSPANLGEDLSNDHPISMEYGKNPAEFNDLSTLLANRVRLVAHGGPLNVECTSCHDPHDNRYGNFLVMDLSTQKDALCTTCHAKKGWSASAHQTGGTRYGGATATEVAQNGCVNCHVPHNAQQGMDLLKLTSTGAGTDTNCTAACHNGTGPYSDIAAEFNPVGRYVHPLTYDAGADAHTPDETLPLSGAKKHVHCIDCHNPHETSWTNAPLDANNAPAVNGVLAGVRGVDEGGATVDPAVDEYQVCFRCHSGTSAENGDFNDATLKVTRVYESTDESKRFSSGAFSTHPVTLAGNGSSPNLLSTAQTTSGYIYCASCHQPHGSTEPHMLLARNQDDFSTGLSTSYPLCYSCHSESYLMNTASSAQLHQNHVFGQYPSDPGNTQQVSCSICHDPHGVPNLGQSSDSSTHLVNFDRRFVPADATYSASARSCSISGQGTAGLTCHPGTMANPATY